MPCTHDSDPRDEHLIFVKNVPAYMAVAGIGDLYAQYKPLRVKNIYPNGDITTVVVAFRAYEEASQAQQDTHGIRMDNVVLQVEMYNKHRSLRFLKEGRATHRRFRDVHENIENETEGYPAHLNEGKCATALQDVHQKNPETTTWAQIVQYDRKPRMTPLSAPATALCPQSHIGAEESETCKLETKMTTFYFPFTRKAETDGIRSITVGSDGTLLGTSNMPTTEFVGWLEDLKSNCHIEEHPFTPKEKTVIYSGIFAVSEPINTDKRIRQRHYQDCTFCQMRLRFCS
jgi:hypothetical protein